MVSADLNRYFSEEDCLDGVQFPKLNFWHRVFPLLVLEKTKNTDDAGSCSSLLSSVESTSSVTENNFSDAKSL